MPKLHQGKDGAARPSCALREDVRMTLTLTDLFCGAGGSSTGAIAVPGIEVRIASNHWDLAVETHNTNHPGADHLCADLSAVDPRRFPRTDILWASPECTNHSVARGKRREDAQPDLFGEAFTRNNVGRPAVRRTAPLPSRHR
jgi:hypothetical protein